MRILALETSTEYLSVALTSEQGVVARDCLAGQRHSELILPMVEAVLAESGMALSEIQAIAFGAGPGSFTGLRIACGVAQGLAFGLGVPVIPIPTLEAVAEGVDKDRVMIALDARMSEVYCGAFERSTGGWKTLMETCLCKPDQAPALAGTGWFAAGSGFAVHADVLTERYAGQIIGVDAEAIPHARAVALLGKARYAKGLTVPPAEAAPLYIRNKVALTVDEQAALR